LLSRAIPQGSIALHREAMLSGLPKRQILRVGFGERGHLALPITLIVFDFNDLKTANLNFNDLKRPNLD
jgi:hypothetical protein